jgi:hypothetical protein
MTPSLPHRVTIGTGDWRISPTVVLVTCDQFSIGPSGVIDQSFSAIRPPSSPEVARKPGRMFSDLPDENRARLAEMIGERVDAAEILGANPRDIGEIAVLPKTIARTVELIGGLPKLGLAAVRLDGLDADKAGELACHARGLLAQ